ncbi:MAG: hypothetical protein ACI870_000521, partial [Crocinitomicaceae bacterium]
CINKNYRDIDILDYNLDSIFIRATDKKICKDCLKLCNEKILNFRH